MSITTYLRSVLGVPLNATQFDANITNLAAAIENVTTGHDHDGTDSKKIGALIVGSDADGDMYYRASGVLARLAKGAANLRMFMNAGGTAPEWAPGVAVKSFTRDLAAAGADVAYTGVGFKPAGLVAIGRVDSSFPFSVGFAGPTGAALDMFCYGVGTMYGESSLVSGSTGAGADQSAIIKSYDSDGFTLTWSRVGAPTGTLSVMVLCIR